MNPQLAKILGLSPEELDQLDPAILAQAVGQNFGEGPRAGGPPDPMEQAQLFGRKHGMTPTEAGNFGSAAQQAINDVRTRDEPPAPPPPAREVPAYQTAPAPAFLAPQPRRTELPAAVPPGPGAGVLRPGTWLGGEHGMQLPGFDPGAIKQTAKELTHATFPGLFEGLDQPQAPTAPQTRFQPVGVVGNERTGRELVGQTTNPEAPNYLKRLFPAGEVASSEELDQAVKQLGGDTGPTTPPGQPTGGDEAIKASEAADSQAREARREKLEMWRGVGGGLTQFATGLARMGGARVDLGSGTEGIDRAIAEEEDQIPISMLHHLREMGIDMPAGTTYSELHKISPELTTELRARAMASRTGTLEQDKKRALLMGFHQRFENDKNVIGLRTMDDQIQAARTLLSGSHNWSKDLLGQFETLRSVVPQRLNQVEINAFLNPKGILERLGNTFSLRIGNQISDEKRQEIESALDAMQQATDANLDRHIDRHAEWGGKTMGVDVGELKASLRGPPGAPAQAGKVKVRTPDGRTIYVDPGMAQALPQGYTLGS